ncbi:PH RCC1 and FYVE domains-containing protein 1 [Bienertia sinuspersici]
MKGNDDRDGRGRRLSEISHMEWQILLAMAVFRRYLRPDKDYLSFSLIYNNGKRSLDLVGNNV